MSVPKSKRSQPKCIAVLRAKELVDYTIRITNNEKNFKVTYKALTEDIIHCAERIYIECYTANNVYVNSKDTLYIRLNHQKSAINECKNFLALIKLAYEFNHLSTKRVEYWTSMTIGAQQTISAWHKADKDRYKKYK